MVHVMRGRVSGVTYHCVAAAVAAVVAIAARRTAGAGKMVHAHGVPDELVA